MHIDLIYLCGFVEDPQMILIEIRTSESMITPEIGHSLIAANEIFSLLFAIIQMHKEVDRAHKGALNTDSGVPQGHPQ